MFLLFCILWCISVGGRIVGKMLFWVNLWSFPWWQFSYSNPPTFHCHLLPATRLQEAISTTGGPHTSYLFKWGRAQSLVSNSGTMSLNQMLVERLFCPEFIDNKMEKGRLIQRKEGRWCTVYFMNYQRTNITHKYIDFSPKSA